MFYFPLRYSDNFSSINLKPVKVSILYVTMPLVQIIIESVIVFNFKLFVLLRINEEFRELRLSDLRVLATLGVGGFGRVELVQIAHDSSRSFALKQMKKSQVSTYIWYKVCLY